MKAGKDVLVFNSVEDTNFVQLVTIKEENIPEELNGESGFHICHVRMMTELMLRYLCQTQVYSLSEEEIEHISVASTLHDVGKSKIPKSILDYPGKLSPVEYDIVKKHTTLGARILENCEFDSVAPEIKNMPLTLRCITMNVMTEQAIRKDFRERKFPCGPRWWLWQMPMTP